MTWVIFHSSPIDCLSSTTVNKVSLTLRDIQNLRTPFCVIDGSMGNFDATTRWEYTYIGPKSVSNLYEMFVPCWWDTLSYHTPHKIISLYYQVLPQFLQKSIHTYALACCKEQQKKDPHFFHKMQHLQHFGAAHYPCSFAPFVSLASKHNVAIM